MDRRTEGGCWLGGQGVGTVVQTKQADSEGRRTQRVRVCEGETQFTLCGWAQDI